MKFPNAVFKDALLLLFVALLLTGGAETVRGQSALDGFDPNANGEIRAVAVQPDGKVVIGGDFTTLSPNGGAPVTRNRIARLNPDGSLDLTFNPSANGNVYAIALQTDGKILVGGYFSGANSMGGQTRNRIARLDATGSPDSFDPNANADVLSIAVQVDGKVLIGGDFSSLSPNGGGVLFRSSFARMNADGTLDTAFNPTANDTVYAITTQADGKILAGGLFTSIGGQPRGHLARLDATTGVADSFNPNTDIGVLSLALQADGKILVGGYFTTVSGQARNRIARVDPTTGFPDSFNPNANGYVNAIAVQPDGKILVGGLFNGANSIGGQTRNRIARLDATTGLADSFDPNAGAGVNSIAVQADGKVLVAGVYAGVNSMNGQTRNRIARLETDGRLDRTLNLSTVGSFVFATAVQADGKILLGGTFTSVLGVARTNIARLNSDGTLDTNFNPNANSAVYAIAVQTDGKVLAGGAFTSIGGQARIRLARLDAVTGSADSFNPNPNGGDVLSIAVQADGKILASGLFTTIGGQPRNRIARLDPVSGLADSFDPNANNQVISIAVQADGKVLAGGVFTSIGGQARTNLARLDAANGAADSFDPKPNNTVRAIAVQADGKILAGGVFTSIGGQTRNNMARLDATSGAADSFAPNPNGFVFSIAMQADGKVLAGGTFTSIGGQARNFIARLNATNGDADSFAPNANSSVASIAVQADGKILAAGDFTAIGGQSRDLFARLSNDTAALQNLAVTQTNVVWICGGSSPQFARVVFEFSTNNVNYTFLGNGTASGTNWTLTGLNLLTGQNIYVRARGYYHSGYQNGSVNFTESVRNAFIVAQPFLNIQRSANTNVVLSWATNFTGFTLESNTNLNTNVWSVVTNAPAVSGTNNVVTNAIGGSARFYRLRQ